MGIRVREVRGSYGHRSDGHGRGERSEARTIQDAIVNAVILRMQDNARCTFGQGALYLLPSPRTPGSVVYQVDAYRVPALLRVLAKADTNRYI